MSGAILEQLEAAVRAARQAGADDVEVSHEGKILGTTRFGCSRITQAGAMVERQTRVRVALGERVGAARTSGLDPAALAEAARQALDAARLSPPQPGFPGFGRSSGSSLITDAGITATAEFTPADRAHILGATFARGAKDNLECAGSFSTMAREVAVATSGGVAVAHRSTEAQLSIIALTPGGPGGDSSGHAVYHGGDVTTLDARAMAERACDTAVRSRDPIDLAPDAFDVVLSPPAVAELCEWLAMTSFGARNVLDGMSFLGGHTGEAICAESITISDEPHFAHPSAVPSPFDAEGVARQRVLMIDRGRAGLPVSDLTTAVKLAATGDARGSTGHAPPFTTDLSDGPIPANLVFHPGVDSVDDLVARVERGLYVTRFHYVNGLLDTRRATMTGMTRDGTFLIENGRVGRGVKNLRFTESILDALNRVGGIGQELCAVPTSWAGHGAYLCPAILLRGFRFTGKSR